VVARPQGCPACRETGYLGREAVNEVLTFDPALSEMVRAGASIAQIRQFCVERGDFMMYNHAIEKVAALACSPRDAHELVLLEEMRFRQANDHLSQLIPILSNGNLDPFIEIVEKEALSLHAMMMTSSPYFMLMRPNTLEIIERIWSHRRETGSKLCFTLDAGANVHLLYPKGEKESVETFIEKDLARFCQNNQYISDHSGEGATELM